jgi:hypothetical protein
MWPIRALLPTAAHHPHVMSKLPSPRLRPRLRPLPPSIALCRKLHLRRVGDESNSFCGSASPTALGSSSMVGDEEGATAFASYVELHLFVTVETSSIFFITICVDWRRFLWCIMSSSIYFGFRFEYECSVISVYNSARLYNLNDYQTG